MLLGLWIIIGLIGLLVVASTLPFSLYVRGARMPVSDASFSYRTAFHWPWKTFGVGIRRDAQGRYTQLLYGNRCLYERERKRARKKKQKKKERKKGTFSLLRDRKLLSQLIRAGLGFLKELFLCFRRPRLAGDIEIGFSDPVAMGIISGVVYAISTRGMILDDLKIKPNYVDATFTGEVDFSTGARPVRIIVVLTKLLFHLPIRELLRLLRRRKRAVRDKEAN